MDSKILTMVEVKLIGLIVGLVPRSFLEHWNHIGLLL